VQKKLPESVIVSAIQTKPGQFDVSRDELIRLSAAGVTEKELNAMLAASGKSASPASAAWAAPSHQSAQPQANPGTLLGNRQTAPAQNTHTPNPGSKVSLNPQPFPPGPNGRVALQHPEPTRRVAVALGAPKQSQKVTNPKVAQQDAAIIAVLSTQSQAASAEAAQMKLSLRLPAPQGGTVPMRTMSATTGSSLATAPVSNANGVIAGAAGHASLGALPAPLHNLALTCSHDPTMRVLTVSGGPTPVIFTPNPKYNFYTITGCSFGNSGTNSKVYIYYQGTFREDFQIQQWSDNFIQVSLDQNITGVDDQNNINFVVQRDDGKQWTKNGYKFYAARQTVRLSQIPNNYFSINQFRPDQSILSSWKPTYTSASSAAVTPNLPGLSAEVHWDITTDPNGSVVGGKDDYDFSHLHSSFVPDSASMEYRDISCTDPNYPLAKSSNSWSLDWYGNSGLQVSWQGQVCNPAPWNRCGGGPIVHNDCFEGVPESNYGIDVWVTGPRGLDPWTGKPGS
jgi:hypothetical protein